MHKIKGLLRWMLTAVIQRLRIGDYVFVFRWSDGDLNDPWAVGFLTEMGEDRQGKFYRVIGQGRYYRNCRKISKEEGCQIIEKGVKVI